jgi:capsular polysaccharide biosynthesis protein/Mrp family chromosome partitioning ATPase
MITLEEILSVFRAVLRWWWLCILAVAISAGTAFYISRGEQRYYMARASLMVSNSLLNPRPEQYQLSIALSLARFYAELAQRSRILAPVQEKLQLPFSWEIIGSQMLATTVIPSANMLEVSVTDSSPQRAAAIANAVGEELVSYSPTSPEKTEAEQRVVEQQLKDSEARINEIKVKIDDLTARQKAATSASDLADINQTLNELSATLEREQSTYASLLSYKSSSAVNSLNFFERAVPPAQPLPSKRMTTVALAGVAGLLLAFVAIVVLDRLDRRWRGGPDMERRFKLDNLGLMPNGPPLLVASPLFFEERFQAARNVQTNIMLAAPASGARTLMLSSPQPSEARAAFSIDLADLFARAGQKVLIVDAEFTRSFLTQMLAFQSGSYGWTVMPGNDADAFWSYLRPTPIPNVALLPGPATVRDMPALLPSSQWHELVNRLLSMADVVIFDGPSALAGPDAALLAPHVEGIVLTLDPAVDSHEDVHQSKQRLLRHQGSKLLGAVTFMPPRYDLNGRRALKAPDQPDAPAPQAPPARPRPARPIAKLRLFGREFQVVWGQSKQRRARPAPPEPAGQPPRNVTPTPIYERPAARGPIITMPPSDEQASPAPSAAGAAAQRRRSKRRNGTHPGSDDAAAQPADDREIEAGAGAPPPRTPIITIPPETEPDAASGQENVAPKPVDASRASRSRKTSRRSPATRPDGETPKSK